VRNLPRPVVPLRLRPTLRSVPVAKLALHRLSGIVLGAEDATIVNTRTHFAYRAFVVHSDREDVALSVALGFSQEHVGVRVKYRDGSLVD
jgi:hypothetical protein